MVEMFIMRDHFAYYEVCATEIISTSAEHSETDLENRTTDELGVLTCSTQKIFALSLCTRQQAPNNNK